MTWLGGHGKLNRANLRTYWYILVSIEPDLAMSVIWLCTNVHDLAMYKCSWFSCVHSVTGYVCPWFGYVQMPVILLLQMSYCLMYVQMSVIWLCTNVHDLAMYKCPIVRDLAMYKCLWFGYVQMSVINVAITRNCHIKLLQTWKLDFPSKYAHILNKVIFHLTWTEDGKLIQGSQSFEPVIEKWWIIESITFYILVLFSD